MTYKTENKCSICQSKYRLECEEMRVKQGKTYQEISDHMATKYGYKVSAASIHRHFMRHFDYLTDEMKLVQVSSRKLFKETMIDAGERSAKLSGMITAAYEYVSTHFDELDMKTALQMLFGSIDQLNKMEGTGLYAGSDFLIKFQGLLDSIKRGNTEQPKLIYDVSTTGQVTQQNDEAVNLPKQETA